MGDDLSAEESFTFERYGKLILQNLQMLAESVSALSVDVEKLERKWAEAEAARRERERMTRTIFSIVALLWGTLGGLIVAFFTWALGKK